MIFFFVWEMRGGGGGIFLSSYWEVFLMWIKWGRRAGDYERREASFAFIHCR